MLHTKYFLLLVFLSWSPSCFSGIPLRLTIHNQQRNPISFITKKHDSAFQVNTKSRYVRKIFHGKKSTKKCFTITTLYETMYLQIQPVTIPYIKEDVVEITLLDKESKIYDSYALKSNQGVHLYLQFPENATPSLTISNTQREYCDVITEIHREDCDDDDGKWEKESIEGTTIHLGLLYGKKIEINNAPPAILTIGERRNLDLALSMNPTNTNGIPTLSIQTIELPLSKIPFMQVSLLDPQGNHRNSVAATFSPYTDPSNRSLVVGTNEENNLCFKQNETQARILYTEGSDFKEQDS